MVVDGARTEGSRDVIRGCGGTKKHRKSHRSSAFNRRVKNLSVTGHLRSETKVRLRSSRRGPMLPGRPRRHSRSALEQGERHQGRRPSRKKPPQRSPSAFPKTAIHLLDSRLEPDYSQFLARMVDQPGAMLVLLRVVVRRLVVQIGVKADAFVKSIVLDEERVRVFTGTPKTARIGGALF